MDNKIAMIMPYFGKWPKWINLFFYSCGKNEFIDFYIFSDYPKPHNLSKNIIFTSISWEEYCKQISDALDVNFKDVEPYKLCDIRPAYGYIYQNILDNYQFWGYGDIDLSYGNLKSWLTNKLLDKYNIISTHANRLSGHFCLIRNTAPNRNAFRKFKNWKKRITDKKVYGFDEYDFTEYFVPNIYWVHRIDRYIGAFFGISHYKIFSMIMPFFLFRKKIHMKELWTSPAPKESEKWIYNLSTGEMTSPNRKKLPYLHFLFFKKTPFYQTDIYWKDDFWKVSDSTINQGKGFIIFTNKEVFYKEKY